METGHLSQKGKKVSSEGPAHPYTLTYANALTAAPGAMKERDAKSEAPLDAKQHVTWLIIHRKEVLLLSNELYVSTEGEINQYGIGCNSFISKSKTIIYSETLIAEHSPSWDNLYLHSTTKLNKYLSWIFHKITMGKNSPE